MESIFLATFSGVSGSKSLTSLALVAALRNLLGGPAKLGLPPTRAVLLGVRELAGGLPGGRSSLLLNRLLDVGNPLVSRGLEYCVPVTLESAPSVLLAGDGGIAMVFLPRTFICKFARGVPSDFCDFCEGLRECTLPGFRFAASFANGFSDILLVSISKLLL